MGLRDGLNNILSQVFLYSEILNFRITRRNGTFYNPIKRLFHFQRTF